MWSGYCFGNSQDYASDKDGALAIAKQYGYKTLEEAFDDGAYYFAEWEELGGYVWYESEHEDGSNAYEVSNNKQLEPCGV